MMPSFLKKTLRVTGSAVLLALLTAMLLLLTACGGGGGAGGGKVLAWIGEGVSPYEKSPGSTGKIAYINGDGSVENVLDVPSGAVGVYACGNQASAPDDSAFAFFINTPQAGADTGTLYQVRGTDTPSAIGGAHALTCLGNGALHYSPDSSRLGYIDFGSLTETAEYATGHLRFVRRDNLNVEGEFENVAAFHLLNNGAFFVSLFTGESGNQAREAAVNVWDGSNAQEIATLYTEEGCRMTNAEITSTSTTELSDRILVVIGQRCNSTGTGWQFYTINRADGTAVRIGDGNLNTQYTTSTRTNNLFPTSDSDSLYFTLPDGIVLNSTSIVTVSGDSINLDTPVVDRNALMPRYVARTFGAPSSASPVFSRDGKWLAMAVTGQSLSPTATVLSLTNPSEVPVTVTTGDRGGNIPFMTFTPNSGKLFYLAGGGGGQENTVFVLDMSSTTETRLQRGRFGVGVPSPDSGSMALLEWKRSEEANSRTYVDLVTVAGSGEDAPVVRFSGLVKAEDGSITGRRFAYPLVWR